MDNSPVLYIFSGLPGVGKSTLATTLAKHIGATYLRVDTIEQGLRDFYLTDIYDEGYQLAFRLAKDNLKIGLSVIGDSCNSITESRTAWQQIATDLGIQFVNIEVICSDESEHQVRVETRKTSIPNLTLPTWKQVQEREYQVWENEVLKVDTANQTIQQSVSDLFQLLKQTY
ncbi:AAA family ATPase [Paraglaciecola arctica]|uniref:Kinase n=1 Tax=Paraglaciecola arctica BSs20135 TaxID=493475 RepID=K6YVQ5_9ALTE|nr:AAA family ATPase [Paraglaciecola arctica]GAC20783.1 kinase [Paraglaciecola arctica BSs20135]